MSKAATSPQADSAEGAAATPPAGGGKKRMILMGAGVLLMGAAGGGISWLLLPKGSGAPAGAATAEAPPAPPPKPPVFLPLDPFTVNLHPDSGEKYLQVAVTLQIASSSVGDQLKQHMPQIRSRVLMLLSSKTATELANAEGKEKLRKEILEQVSRPVFEQGKPFEVSDALYTAFVIQ